MKNKPTIILTACSFLSVLIVFVLYAITENKATMRYDFDRIILSEVISEDTAIDLGYSSYYIAGATADKLYFGNSMAPLHMIESDKALTDTSHIELAFENGKNLKFKSIQVKVDSPYFFVSEGTQPYLLRGKLGDWYAQRFMFDSAYFSLAIPLSASSFAIRSRSARTQEDVLGKESWSGVEFFPGLLEKQVDGVFCVDGMLHYSKALNAVVYLYYYRNEYVVMDTSLTLRAKGNTIDPIREAQIKADHYASAGAKTFTLSAPPLLVNSRSCVYDNWMLVNSAIRSQDEDEDLVDQTFVIDVYDLKSQDYQFSFYLQDNYESKLSGIWLFDRKLYAMYGNHVVSYSILREFLDRAHTIKV